MQQYTQMAWMGALAHKRHSTNRSRQWSGSRRLKCDMTFKKETHPRYFGGLRKVKKSLFQPETCVGSGRMSGKDDGLFASAKAGAAWAKAVNNSTTWLLGSRGAW